MYLSQNEALEVAFPKADAIERRSFFLTEEQHEQVEQLARARLESSIVTVYEARSQERLLGYAYIDLHVVRTVQEALMVVLTPEGKVRSVRVLAFYEPSEYLPNDRWRGQFEGRGLDDDVVLDRGISAIAGATLSARAATSSVRRTLALYRVLIGREPETVRGGSAPVSQRAVSQPTASEPTASEPAASEPAASEPAASEPVE